MTGLPPRTIAASLVLLMLITGCSDSRVFPPVDTRYSEFLSVLGENYAAIAGSSASTTVGVVQIFAGDRRTLIDLAEATRGELLLESRQRDVIERLIAAVQQREPTTTASCDLGKVNWVLVAYDSALFRAGVIRLYSCNDAGETVIGVAPAGDAAITYSRQAVVVLRTLGLIASK